MRPTLSSAYSLFEQNPNALPLLLILAAGVLFILLPGGKDKPATTRRTRNAEEIVRKTNQSFWTRMYWVMHPTADMMRVDGLVLDRTGDRSHCLWIGPTGRGKSQSVATVRCDGNRPWLAVMPDLSIPLRERADFIWTAGESTMPVDFLNGTEDDVAHFLTEVFRSGGEGVWKREAFMATKRVVADIDRRKEQRSLLLIGTRLKESTDANPALRRMCEGWVTRFLGAAEAMGDSAGPNGVDVADLLNRGLNVVLDNNAWRRPGLKGDVVAFGLAEAKRVADLVPGGFRLIFEEADQLGDRIDLADPFFTAGRLRQIAVDALVHSEHKLPDAMQTNSATRVYFRPNKPEHREKVAKALDLSEAAVDKIPDYHAWIEHDGKIRRLVKFPKPPRHSLSIPVSPLLKQDESPRGETSNWVIQELRPPAPILPALPAPSLLMQELLDRSLVMDGCRRWLGMHDKAGYGYISLNGRKQLVHRVAWEAINGPIPLIDGEALTIDHRRTCHKDCFELSHLELCTRAENSRRRWRVRGVAAS